MSKDEEKEKHDIVLIHGITEDGAGMHAVRSRPDRLDFAELRPAPEGEDVSNLELVRLRPRKQAPFICDVDVLYTPEQQSTASSDHGGPPRFTTNSYRQNWDIVFGLAKTKSPKNTILN